jgi:predicted DNA-binding transcriptional regulator YafY
MEICKHGSALEVLAPAEVRDAVAAELRKAADIYSKP